MSEVHERLQAARKAAGYESATAAAEALGWAVSTYLGHENGSRGLGVDVARQYAAAFDVQPERLLFGDASEGDAQDGTIARSDRGKAIRDAREALGWSQARLARSVDTTQQTIDKLEKGQVTWSRHLAPIEAALGLSGDQPMLSPPQPAPSITVRPSGRVTIDIKAEVSVSVAAQILNLIEGDKR